MNGFKLMADSYRKLMNEGIFDKETAEKEIRIYEFLATCDEDDFCRMVDSGAFNDIIKAYAEEAAICAGSDVSDISNGLWRAMDGVCARRALDNWKQRNYMDS